MSVWGHHPNNWTRSATHLLLSRGSDVVVQTELDPALLDPEEISRVKEVVVCLSSQDGKLVFLKAHRDDDAGLGIFEASVDGQLPLRGLAERFVQGAGLVTCVAREADDHVLGLGGEDQRWTEALHRVPFVG